jgi:hypothetical protein
MNTDKNLPVAAGGAPLKIPVQAAGGLPAGCDLDALLTPEQFAAWQQVPLATVRKRLAGMAGVVRHSRQCVRIHPRTYLAANLPANCRKHLCH